MKLAAIYSVFNGLELLEGSIKQIESLTDEIIIVYQTMSNTGNVSAKVEPFLYGLNEKFHLVKFIPDLNVSTKENERVKHQIGIDYAKKLDCTHFFFSATDHYYLPYQFATYKKICETLNCDLTFTSMLTFYKHPTWQLTPIEDYYMPFICKLFPHTKIIKTSSYPAKVDPSLKINSYTTWKIFEQDEIMMFHFSMIRKDIRNKFNNAAASIRWKPGDIERFVSEYENYNIETNPGISYFGGRKIKIVENTFSL